MESLREEWGQRVTQRRRDLKLTQEQLAILARTKQSTISKLEGGKYVPSDEMKLAIAAALQRPVLDLFPLPIGVPTFPTSVAS